MQHRLATRRGSCGMFSLMMIMYLHRADPVDVNGPFCSVCVEDRTQFMSRSGQPDRRAQRVDASCPALAFINLNANEKRRELKKIALI
jgi:hypothetical protein